MIKIYFSDFFEIDKSKLDNYGAFNISLINDLPLFIDPFLVYSNKKHEYQELHKSILKYLTFLKEKSEQGIIHKYQIKSWYLFPEVKQNWLGYSIKGNGGRGLGPKFGKAMSSSVHLIFDDLGKERVTQSSHLEKAMLFEDRIGKDNISDFATNLMKEYLLEFTEKFAVENIDIKYLKKINVDKVYFDYSIERWMPKEFTLPYIFSDYVILSPRDLLTKDENWINVHELRGDFLRICNGLPNDQLRHEIQNFYLQQLPAPNKDNRNSQKEITIAVQEAIKKYPEIIKYFIKEKEENKIGAAKHSKQKLDEVESIFVTNTVKLAEKLLSETEFYLLQADSYSESLKRINFLKTVIEKNDGYKLFYMDNKPIKREADLQVIYRLTWYATSFDVNREPNNGRGPVDYSISKGAFDKTLVEFKLASNSKLKKNLESQVDIYQQANNTSSAIKVIMYFDMIEYKKVQQILKELDIEKNPNIILIDACKKVSASNA